jgi:hypothetical protein
MNQELATGIDPTTGKIQFAPPFKQHRLKIAASEYELIEKGMKTFMIIEQQGYEEGDSLVLVPCDIQTGKPTGKLPLYHEIGYISTFCSHMDGPNNLPYVIISLR